MQLRSDSQVAHCVACANDVNLLSYPEGGGKSACATSPQSSANASVHPWIPANSSVPRLPSSADPARERWRALRLKTTLRGRTPQRSRCYRLPLDSDSSTPFFVQHRVASQTSHESCCCHAFPCIRPCSLSNSVGGVGYQDFHQRQTEALSSPEY